MTSRLGFRGIRRRRMAITPFGDPDGSRVDIKEIHEGFVQFKPSQTSSDITTAADDRKARVIVGRKGSGKTVYLRRLQANAALEESMYATDIDYILPNTDVIVSFCHKFANEVLDEKWTSLWRAAFLRCVSSHLIHSPKIGRQVPQAILKILSKDYENILPYHHRVPV